MEDQKPKNLGGRPTLYSEEMQKKADNYLLKPLFETYQKEIVVSGQIQIINCERPNGIPSVAELSLELDVHRDTIYEWIKVHPKFSDTFERLKAKQKQFLNYHGLTKGYDSGFAKFVAVNVTDYKDKIEQDINQKTIQINIDDQDKGL